MMAVKRFCLCLLLLLAGLSALRAQSECEVTHYDEFSGMSQWWVTQIVQDCQGMMWFATWNGLNRYDGYQFECFKSQAGDDVDTPSDRIQDLMLSDDGTLLRQQPTTGTWQPYPQPHQIKGSVNYCTTDRQGNLWLRSNYDAFKLTFWQSPYTPYPQEKPTQVRYFYIDQQQRYWITTQSDATVRLYDRDNHLLGYLGRDGRLHAQYTPFVAPVYCILQDSKGVFWLGSKPGGLFRLHDGRWILALQNGAFTLRPQDIHKSTFVPPIALTGLSVENRPTQHAVNHLDTLLLVQGKSVNDAAYACGFSDPKYFGKCFKAQMGMTPTEYKVENSVSDG